jgi:hypothetical protein
MTRLQRLYLALAATFVVSFVTVFALQAGTLPAVIIGGAMTLALPAWAATSLRHPTDPAKLLPAYLLTAALLMLHIGEEYMFDFGPRIAAIAGSDWTQDQFATAIVFFGPIVWILGAVAITYRHPLGGFLAWFVFIGMIFGEPVHLVFPLLENGRYAYFPGLWTALLPLVTAIWGMHILVCEARRDKTNPEEPA